MALSPVKTFVAGEVLYAADLNAMNTNILNNGLGLISPLTGNLDTNNVTLVDVGALGFANTAIGSVPATTGFMTRSAARLGVGYLGWSALRSTLSLNTTIVGTVGTGEDNLMSLPLEASFFAGTTLGIRIEAMFHFAANANAKTLKFYLGASGVTLNSVITSPNNVYAYADLSLRRFATNEQRLTGEYVTAACTDPMPTASWTETETSALTIKFTGEATTTNDVRQLAMLVTLVR